MANQENFLVLIPHHDLFDYFSPTDHRCSCFCSRFLWIVVFAQYKNTSLDFLREWMRYVNGASEPFDVSRFLRTL